MLNAPAIRFSLLSLGALCVVWHQLSRNIVRVDLSGIVAIGHGHVCACFELSGGVKTGVTARCHLGCVVVSKLGRMSCPASPLSEGRPYEFGIFVQPAKVEVMLSGVAQ